ncbi:hypothetical protein TIFTF001_022113 [Ficus carica]|uniref:Reverse transcriptase zinc-binding domain-containing protein n=1 Tax=Ficus carica TaxID=3494 RepID=A0AA88AI23_FICCA|nr:hypothetical protein TIFTF001_022113 [Ficus carica]
MSTQKFVTLLRIDLGSIDKLMPSSLLMMLSELNSSLLALCLDQARWKGFWALKIPHKIKSFAWRAYHDAVPTAAGLFRRKIYNYSQVSPKGQVLWALKIPNKIKSYAWRAYHDAIPTAAGLFRRKVIDSACCAACQSAWELWDML